MRIPLTLLCACLLSICQAQEQTPNVLIIIADDLGIDVLDGFGIDGEKPVTPTLDSLRANGLSFTNCWASPQCTPTRAAMISGKYGIKTGMTAASITPQNMDLIITKVFSPRVWTIIMIGRKSLMARPNK